MFKQVKVEELARSLATPFNIIAAAIVLLGLVITDRVDVSKEYYLSVREAARAIAQDRHATRTELNRVSGRIRYIGMVNPERAKRLRAILGR